MSEVPCESAPEAQHGVAAQPSQLWPLLNPDLNYLVYGTPLTAAVLLRYRFLDGTGNQRRAVKSTIETLEKPPESPSFVTWEDCANVKFQEVKGNATAEIRITFRQEVKRNGVVDDWYWSAVGSDSMDLKQFPSHRASMKLAGLPDEYPPSDYHRGNILHEFGHALGLKHEHQSPAFEGVVELNEEVIIKHYHGNEEDARRNVIDKVQEPTNYTQFDKDSIMVYTIDPEWQNTRWWQTSKRILANDKLSDLDQAFIRLIYPPDLSKPDNEEPFLRAMVTAGVDKRTAGLILSDSLVIQGSVGARLTAMRNRFNAWKGGLLLFKKPNKLFWRGIDPAVLRQSGVNGLIGEVTRNKLFQGIVKNIIHRSREQYGIPTNVSLPGGMQNEVMNMLGALAMHADVARTVKYYDGQLRGKYDALPSSALPDEIPKTPTDLGTVEPPVDLSEWSKSAGGKDSSRVRKSLDGKTITVELLTLGKKARLSVNESFNANKQTIDVKGMLRYKTKSDINTGNKANWLPKGIAFYRGDWKSDNIVACFMPSDIADISRTNFPSVTADFENVEWE